VTEDADVPLEILAELLIESYSVLAPRSLLGLVHRPTD
jgi:hypothetical protein